MALDNFKLKPKGNVKLTLSWASHRLDFMNGTPQFYRKRIHAKKSYQFVVAGKYPDALWLYDFYNAHKGSLKPFIFSYESDEEVYFAGALSFKHKLENNLPVVYEAEISLDIDHRAISPNTPSELDELPRVSVGDITESLNWNTKVYTTSSTDRREENEVPIRKLQVKFSGSKKTRDRIISLYESHEMMPLLFTYKGQKLKVRLPDSVTITDKRESQQIVGFECEMELEIVNG